MTDVFDRIRKEIINDAQNADMRAKGYEPLYTANAKSRIVIIGQAPGIKAQDTKKPWNDLSGKLLREWLGIRDEQFYDPDLVALIPMDFYYPGKGTHGDLPPRKGFAEKWHPQLFEHMSEVKLTILIGAYAQKYYLGKNAKPTLTETVLAYQDYLPQYFPLVHPSPLNFRWQAKNPWFTASVVPELISRVREILS